MNTFVILAVVVMVLNFLAKAAKKQGYSPRGAGKGPVAPPLKSGQGQSPGYPRTLRELAQEMLQGEVRWDTRMPIDSIPKRIIRETVLEDSDKQQELRQAAGKEGEWGDEGRSLPESLEADRASGVTSGLVETGQELPQAKNQELRGNVRFDGRDLAQAVVWSEILGKPRALKPFRGPRG